MSAGLKEALATVVGGGEPDAETTAAAIDEIMAGEAPEALVGGFLAAVSARGITSAEVVGAARTMRARAASVSTARAPLVDNCGTGGDGGSTFSVSTAAALVAAGAGAAVAKHGNRAASGKFGGADALEALGVDIEISAEAMGRCLDEVGMAFLFARRVHPAMRHVAPVRAALGIRTIFNLLGPLTNPAGVQRQVIGVPTPEAQTLIADALVELGCERVLVVRGRDGLDEVSLAAPADVVEVEGGEQRRYAIDAETFGLPTLAPEAIRVDDLEGSVAVIREVLAGGKGPRADIVAANAALALVAEGRAADVREGVGLARAAMADGAASDVLARLIDFTNASGGN